MNVAHSVNDMLASCTFTANMAVHYLALSVFEVIWKPADCSRRVAWCGAAANSSEATLHDEDEMLYCFTLSEAERAMSEHPEAMGLLVLNVDESFAASEAPFSEQFLDRTIVVREKTPFGQSLVAVALSAVQIPILKFIHWRDRIVSVIDGSGSMQDLVDCSASMFDNFLEITDSAYGAIAHSKPRESEGGSSRTVLARDEDLLSGMQVARSIAGLADWESQEDVMVFEPTGEIPCSSMTMVIRSGRAYAGHVIMLCNRSEPNPAIVDMFRMFAVAVQTMVSKSNIEAEPAAAFFIRLLSDHRLSSELIGEQCSELGLESPGAFQVALIDNSGGEYAERPLWVSNMLADSLPDCVVCGYKGNILAISTTSESRFELGHPNAEALNDFCTEMDCLAFVSDVFKDIRHVFYAYQQTHITKSYKPCIDIELRPLDDIYERRCFYFSEAFCFYCLDDNEDDGLHAFNIQHTQLDEMIEQNSDREVSDLKLLYFYLFNERKATPTAEQLHMHRNNVLYRVKNIEKKYGLDLNDFSNRQRLLNCYRLKIMASAKFRTMLV